MKQPIDRTGMRYGALTVEAKAEKPEWSHDTKEKHFWLCRCDCGQTTIKGAGELCKKNRKHSCGCLNPNKFDDLTGKNFGKWRVLKREESRKWVTMWLCQCECGNTGMVSSSSLKRAKSTSCGCISIERCVKASGPNSPRWKGGRLTTPAGYILVKDRSHANANKRGYVFEHVLMMTQHLGRALSPHEHVHHVDGNKTNNSLDNLELWAGFHPSGQRVDDLVAFAWKIIEMYDPSRDRAPKSLCNPG